MLTPANRLLDCLVSEFDRLRLRLDDSGLDSSEAHGIANALQLLRNRERGSAEFIKTQIGQLGVVLQRMAGLLGSESAVFKSELEALLARTEIDSYPDRLDTLESAWRLLIADFQSLVIEINGRLTLSGTDRLELAQALADWEAGYRLEQVRAEESVTGTHATAVRIDRDNLSAYLADYLGDPGFSVTAVSPLAGGFGKETTLFKAEGKSLSGSFIIRRDMEQETGVNNDCHRVEKEYEVIRAAFEAGFPAPEALWLDTEHKQLPGGHFIIMRRSPGVLAGDFFGASASVPADLADTLAETIARLHTLPPMTSLGDLTESLCTEWWSLDRGECIRRYLSDWYQLFLCGQHDPSPAIIGLYGWLLDNIPQADGPPVLLHGDVGFHNFLFHENKLSAVLDWEFAHLGHPAEDLGYVKVTIGDALDWERLIEQYIAAGGQPVEPRTLLFFQIWAYIRNASGASLLSNCLDRGLCDDLKMTVLTYGHIPQFIQGAQRLIREYEQAYGSSR